MCYCRGCGRTIVRHNPATASTVCSSLCERVQLEILCVYGSLQVNVTSLIAEWIDSICMLCYVCLRIQRPHGSCPYAALLLLRCFFFWWFTFRTFFCCPHPLLTPRSALFFRPSLTQWERTKTWSQARTQTPSANSLIKKLKVICEITMWRSNSKQTQMDYKNIALALCLWREWYLYLYLSFPPPHLILLLSSVDAFGAGLGRRVHEYIMSLRESFETMGAIMMIESGSKCVCVCAMCPCLSADLNVSLSSEQCYLHWTIELFIYKHLPNRVVGEHHFLFIQYIVCVCAPSAWCLDGLYHRTPYARAHQRHWNSERTKKLLTKLRTRFVHSLVDSWAVGWLLCILVHRDWTIFMTEAKIRNIGCDFRHFIGTSSCPSWSQSCLFPNVMWMGDKCSIVTIDVCVRLGLMFFSSSSKPPYIAVTSPARIHLTHLIWMNF